MRRSSKLFGRRYTEVMISICLAHEDFFLLTLKRRHGHSGRGGCPAAGMTAVAVASLAFALIFVCILPHGDGLWRWSQWNGGRRFHTRSGSLLDECGSI